MRKQLNTGWRALLRASAVVSAALIIAVGGASTAVYAQGAKPPAKDGKGGAAKPPAEQGAKGGAAKPAAPAGQPAAGQPPAGDQALWVKLCDKGPAAHPPQNKDDKAAAPKPEERKTICMTHFEALDPNTAMPFISAAIRQVEGQEKEHLLVMVPTLPVGVVLAAGLRVFVDDDPNQQPLLLQFTSCLDYRCTAEMEANKALIDRLKNGKILRVVAVNMVGKGSGYGVPLNGFGSAYDGAPIDKDKYMEKYMESRRRLQQMIVERQKEAIAKAKEEAEKKEKEAAAGGTAPAGGAKSAGGAKTGGGK